LGDVTAPELATAHAGDQLTGMAHGGDKDTPTAVASADGAGHTTPEPEAEICGGGSHAPPDCGLDGDADAPKQTQEGGDDPSNRDISTMTTLEWSASRKGPDDDDDGGADPLDVMLVKLVVDKLESCDLSKESWPESSDLEIIIQIAQWFDRRKELGDIALLDPVMAQFADEYATLRAKYDERSEKKNALDAEHDASINKYNAAAEVMSQKLRVSLQKKLPAGQKMDEFELYKTKLKTIEEWKQGKMDSLELERIAFNEGTAKLDDERVAFFSKVIDTVTEQNVAAQEHDVDQSLMDELENLLEGDATEIPKAW